MKPARLLALALALSIGIVAAACGGSDSGSNTAASSAAATSTSMPAEPVNITLSYDWPTVDFMAVPIVVADEKGYFAANGVNVEMIFPPDPASATKILATGDSNLGLITTSDMAFAVKSSLPVISIGNYTTGNNWGLFTKPGVTIGLDTLKGKKISTYGDSWTNAMLPFVLKAAGLTDKDVEQVVVDWDLPLLLNGKVDIATNTTNFLIPGVKDETGKNPEWILARDNGAPNTPVWVYAGNKDWLAKNPAAAKGFLAAIAQATEWAGANPDEAATLYEKAYSDNGYSHEYNVIGWTETFKFMKNNDGSLLTQSDEQWTELGDALKSIGQLDTVAEPSAYYTNEYLPTK